MRAKGDNVCYRRNNSYPWWGQESRTVILLYIIRERKAYPKELQLTVPAGEASVAW
jgi:hypothetical protein